MRKHASLTAFVNSLPTDERRALSRIAIYPGIGWSRVRASIALHYEHVPEGIGANGERLGPVLRRPVAVDDAEALKQMNQPVIDLFTERYPDVEGRVPTAELSRQIAELDQSGIVGVLNIEQLPCAIPDGTGWRSSWYYVLTTRGGTQAERNAWLRSKLRSKEPPIPDNLVAL